MVIKPGDDVPVKRFHIILRRFRCICMGMLILLSVTFPVTAAKKVPQLSTNQVYVNQLRLPAVMDIDDAPSVLLFVLKSLPDEVLVYPTENYYYFSFYYGGVKYSGNLRLDASDRDAGKIHFAYFIAYREWRDNLKSTFKVYGLEQGVRVGRIDRLKYRVTFRGRSVVFRLNDLSTVQPPAEVMAAGEQYIGPVFDESAIEFFLVYSRKLKIFHYILNQINPIPDFLVRDKTRNRIYVAQRSGFVFYRDHLRDRLILIGVYERNAVVNNYYDGPFDQLPDNFIRGDMLKRAFIDQNPGVAGKIDRFGNAPDGDSRISIIPYFYYLSLDELYGFDECAQKYKTVPEKYYSCFDAQSLNLE